MDAHWIVTVHYQQIMVFMASPDLAQPVLGTMSLTYASLEYKDSRLYRLLALLHVNV